MVFDTFIVAFIAKAASLIACGLSLIPPGGGKAKIGTLDETPRPEAPAELEVTESSQDLGLVTGPPFEGPSHLEIRFKLKLQMDKNLSHALRYQYQINK